jgi:opacity protein-like surface antigen
MTTEDVARWRFWHPDGIIPAHLAVMRMSVFSTRWVFLLALAALGLGGRAAHAQVAPLTYWIPGWPMGFGGNPAAGQDLNSYGNFPSFDGSDARGGFAYTHTNFSNGFFVASAGGSIGLGLSGFDQSGAFGNLSYQSTQFGYNFQNTPLKIFAGFDTLNYDPGIGGSFAPIALTSGTQPAYGVHAGVEYQPTSNLSLSLGVGYTRQQSGINSLSGTSPFALVGPR